MLELADTALKVAGGSNNNRINRDSTDQTNLVDPIKHKVVREAAFIISRLYNISVRSLADWNGLDSDYTVREGQILIVPLVDKKVQRSLKKKKSHLLRLPHLAPKNPNQRILPNKRRLNHIILQYQYLKVVEWLIR